MTTETSTDCPVTLRLQDVLLAVTGMTPELLFGDSAEEFAPELDEDLQLADDLGFDSVMLMELKFLLEQHFPELGELSLPEILPSLHTVGSLTDCLKRRLSPVEAV
ncbi:phosphopantetheine-binding protein [Kitasatospora sp. GP82]|uniref:acyl carrier protein n=1 Tax=Kitasatospora sp. GP82 TaxID=3035089 RepID=UPI0024762E81|nr:phosphopantetheine-binding protein [Kitasatospora sp. GP82]MDH6129093.1 acyl carrier protein [Kitasatospora sp. GP82]